MNPFWTQSIPIWASRPTGNGIVSHFNVSGWMFLVLAVLVLVNAVAWGCIGIYEAVRFVL